MKQVFLKNSVANVAIILCLILWASWAQALLEEDPVIKPGDLPISRGLFIEYFTYRDYLYSRSRKTEVGDQVKLDSALRYEFNEDTFARLRFETDPAKNRYDNKTSEFEFLFGKRIQNWYFQFDAELNTDDGNSGGSSIGLDLDSRLTYMSWRFLPRLRLSFFPFNFDGQVGRVFNTGDVTRIYFIEGAPSTINDTPLNDERVANKTIPGLELALALNSDFSAYVYAGAGAATYLYPHDPQFHIEDSRTSDRWERRETLGYKLGGYFRSQNHRVEAKYVTHSKSEETGSLLEAGGFIYSISDWGLFMMENEWTYSQAGKRPYRLARSGEWFENTSPYLPIYSDRFQDHQDWLGKSGWAYSLRIGPKFDNFVPYASYKHQTQHFIFRDRESAHILRTNDEALSHGGLNRYGFGTYYYVGDFIINPEFEWLVAKNPVFSNSSDIRQDAFITNYDRDDFLVYVTLTYQFGETRVFKP